MFDLTKLTHSHRVCPSPHFQNNIEANFQKVFTEGCETQRNSQTRKGMRHLYGMKIIMKVDTDDRSVH